MKDIVIIANFCNDFSENDNGRFLYLGKLLAKEHEVEIITSDFNHNTKKRRVPLYTHWPFKVTFAPEPGYSRNVCLRRFYSHWVLSKNIEKYLKSRKRPDIIYCAVPSLDVAHTAAKYAKSNSIRFVIDVQDLWPEAFRMVFNIPIISSCIYLPMKRKANRIYSAADAIVSVSQTYANRTLSVNRKCNQATVVFLGTDISAFNTYKEMQIPKLTKPENEVWMGYIGTLGSSYDLTGVMDAMGLLKKEGKAEKLRLIIMGQGPLKSTFEKIAKEKDLLVEFTGALPYPVMVAQLCECDFAVNPIRAGSAGSVINKVGDYAAAGLAVINTQECQEYRHLLEQNNAGINCKNGDIPQLSNAIFQLYNDVTLRDIMGRNNKKLAEEKFNRVETYKSISEIVCNESTSS